MQFNKFNRLVAKSGNGRKTNAESSNVSNQSQTIIINRNQLQAVNSTRNQSQT